MKQIIIKFCLIVCRIINEISSYFISFTILLELFLDKKAAKFKPKPGTNKTPAIKLILPDSGNCAINTIEIKMINKLKAYIKDVVFILFLNKIKKIYFIKEKTKVKTSSNLV